MTASEKDLAVYDWRVDQVAMPAMILAAAERTSDDAAASVARRKAGVLAEAGQELQQVVGAELAGDRRPAEAMAALERSSSLYVFLQAGGLALVSLADALRFPSADGVAGTPEAVIRQLEAATAETLQATANGFGVAISGAVSRGNAPFLNDVARLAGAHAEREASLGASVFAWSAASAAVIAKSAAVVSSGETFRVREFGQLCATLDQHARVVSRAARVPWMERGRNVVRDARVIDATNRFVRGRSSRG